MVISVSELSSPEWCDTSADIGNFTLAAIAVQFKCLHMRVFQEKPEYARSGELTKELRMADSNLVSKFLEALEENGQQHVVRILVPEGLNMSAKSAIFYLFYIVCTLQPS